MILPAHFAKLAAHGKATIGLVPVTKPRKVTRGGRVGWKVPRPGKGTSYKTTPWTPRTGSHETLRSNTGRKVITLCDIVIGAHHTIHLADLLDDSPSTLQLVRATGCKTRAELAREWMRHADKDWPPTEEELCPRCDGHKLLVREWTNPITGAVVHYAEDCPACDEVGTVQADTLPSDTEILERFERHHAHRQAWLTHFALDGVEHERYLAWAGRDDYTENLSQAMTGSADPGAAIPAAYQEFLSKHARNRERAERDRKIQAGAPTDSARLDRNANRARRWRDAA